MRAPPLWPLPRGDIIPGLVLLRLLHRIPGQLGGPHLPRGLGPRAQGSHPFIDPGRHPHGLIRALPKSLDLSPAFIIRRPYFPCSPIPGNVDCRGRDFHGEIYYLLAISEDSELRDSMLLVQRYHLESFMTPRRYYYPRVVIEFYHTMTSRREANPTALHFSIDGRPGILSGLRHHSCSPSASGPCQRS